MSLISFHPPLGQGTELTHFESSMFFASVIIDSQLYLNIVAFSIDLTSLPQFKASLVYSRFQQNMNIGCEFKSFCYHMFVVEFSLHIFR